MFGFFLFIAVVLVMWYVYDKYVQREHQLLTNYPVIGRMRYILEMVREPFRQYFADEDFYESRDKVEWVYKASKDIPNYLSFSPSQPLPKPKFMLKHSVTPLNDHEVDKEFTVIFGADKPHPFTAHTVVLRSAMSDGAISPEGTRAFVRGAKKAGFPINTGEGSLTTNFFITDSEDATKPFMQNIYGNKLHKLIYYVIFGLFNGSLAARVYRDIVLPDGEEDTYVFDKDTLVFYRPDWTKSLDEFPNEIPRSMPDIIFQMGSGLYGVRDKDGKFDELRYQKVMKFCRMSEIKLAQGAKQTGGKLLGSKVSDSVAYFRGVEAGKNLISPNRFPYANTIEELFDFVGRLQKLSGKPVGIKVVISDMETIAKYTDEIKRRASLGLDGVPDYINIDGGDGGSGTAPLELMERIGLGVKDAVYLVDKKLRELRLRERIKIIANGKVLTPDDVAIVLAIGADMTGIARGFMMSAGCIRARHCSGTNGHDCPVGLASQNKSKRLAYLVYKHADKVANYHNNLIKGLKMILAVMGLKNPSELTQEHLMFVDQDGYTYSHIKDYYEKKLIH